jgi:hypothetical protein
MPVFPSSILFSQAKLTSAHATQLEYTRNGQRNAVKRTGHLFKLELQTKLLSPLQTGILEAFFDAMEGRYTPFDFDVHTCKAYPLLGAGGGTPLADGAFAVGVSSVASDGWPNGVAVLKKGDLIQFASHRKTYRLTEDATANGSGQATLSFKPQLMVAVADNSAITYNPVLLRVAFEADELDITRTTTPWNQGQFNFVEAWNV